MKPLSLKQKAQAQILKDFRIKRGMTLKAAAAKLGCSTTLISQIENFKEYPPTGDRLTMFLKTYKMGIEYFDQLSNKLAKEAAETSKIDEKAIDLLRKLPTRQQKIISQLIMELSGIKTDG
ncbi:MAG: helix-turn-helix transcriptional regulator [Bdellovibrionales bacterium]|nr:helix-turn-helix transcriptional regulator [Bdellovibrionales bacterium]